MTSLTYLNVDNNQLTSLDVSHNTSLTYLDVDNNPLVSIDVSNNKKLVSIYIRDTPIETINLSNNVDLENLWLGSRLGSNNQEKGLNELDVTKNTKLKSLYIYGTGNLKGINLSSNPLLKVLSLQGAPKIESINIDNNPLLEHIAFDGNNIIKTLDLSNKNLKSVMMRQDALETLNLSNNQLESLDLLWNHHLKYLDVSNNKLTEIKDLDMINDVNTVAGHIGQDVLQVLNIENNMFEAIDLSNATSLRTLNMKNNNFGNKIVTYVTGTGTAVNKVKLPSHLDKSISWSSNNSNVATVDSNGNITTVGGGNTNIIGTNRYYDIKTKVNVAVLKSDKYQINDIKNYVYVGSETDMDIINSNLNIEELSGLDVTVLLDISNHKLKLMNDDNVIKEFNIIQLSSDKYQIDDEDNYIYTGSDSDTTTIKNHLNTSELEESGFGVRVDSINNTLRVYELANIDNIIKRYKMIYLTSDKFNLSSGKIYVGKESNESIIENITCVNCNLSINNGNLIVKDENNNELDEINLVRLNTTYVVGDDYIYTGSDTNINTITNNLNIDELESSGIQVLVDEVNKVIELNMGAYSIGEYDILAFKVSGSTINNNTIEMEDGMSYSNFINNITTLGNITYKIYNGSSEVTSGNIENNMIVKLYYNGNVIKEYKITDKNDYIELDESLSLLEEDNILYKLSLNNSIKSVCDLIDTSGNKRVFKNNDEILDRSGIIKTGYIIRIELINSIMEYMLSVKGDTSTDGISDITDVVQTAEFLIDGKGFMVENKVDRARRRAGDINSDNVLDITDLVQMAEQILNR